MKVNKIQYIIYFICYISLNCINFMFSQETKATVNEKKFESNFQEKYRDRYNLKLITSSEEFSYENIESFEPDIIFLPHWSAFIPSVIYDKYETIVFHMTDLPYGRGGSPLRKGTFCRNLINKF